jgi:hypothetical protein
MLFSDSARIPLHFQKATFKQTKEGAKFAKMHFAVKLTPEIASTAPKLIQAAYEAVETRENQICSALIGKDLEGVQIEFYSLPEKGRPTQALPLNLTELSVQRLPLGDPWLYFSAAAKLNDREPLRHWVVDNVFCQLWATFQMSQMELGDVTGAIGECQDKMQTLCEKDGTKLSMKVSGGKEVVIADGTKKRKPR